MNVSMANRQPTARITRAHWQQLSAGLQQSLPCSVPPGVRRRSREPAKNGFRDGERNASPNRFQFVEHSDPTHLPTCRNLPASSICNRQDELVGRRRVVGGGGAVSVAELCRWLILCRWSAFAKLSVEIATVTFPFGSLQTCPLAPRKYRR